MLGVVSRILFRGLIISKLDIITKIDIDIASSILHACRYDNVLLAGIEVMINQVTFLN